MYLLLFYSAPYSRPGGRKSNHTRPQQSSRGGSSWSKVTVYNIYPTCLKTTIINSNLLINRYPMERNLRKISF